jgi:predicted TIM-barrel fold metal-dependent hydrolase
MRIDINAFFGHWQFWPLPHPGIDDVLRLMDRYDIDHAAITSLRGLYGERPEANAETLAAAKAHRDRLTPVAVMSPMNGDDAAELRSLVEQGFRAVRMYPLLHAYRLYDPFADEVCETAAEIGVPVIVCTRPMMNFRFATVPIEEVGELAGRHRATQFVLSGPNYLTEFRAAVLVMRKWANVAIELTCMQGFGALRRTVEEVGPERVLFGTGMPLHYAACNVAKLTSAKVSEAVREAVGGGNARRLLGT